MQKPICSSKAVSLGQDSRTASNNAYQKRLRAGLRELICTRGVNVPIAAAGPVARSGHRHEAHALSTDRGTGVRLSQCQAVHTANRSRLGVSNVMGRSRFARAASRPMDAGLSYPMMP
ncbi:hypothetical protein BO82DRAFT_369447 [Aspergillus uvarum CBS 121591]|uniref:Uncharacterized protein n=1 Tax=Aspergillus uvarum CBS 121591 TaxID=1448315 RepID=A0A319BVT4_9EURO|nr:hypothetical protein BO82DRAFT_369447 [Aspergillus uvarum CBS 121591]PYH76337.1 hypothetical protein BO82DRAFT_369447 [Aspergillus uvarum CBS 121591]